MNNVIFFSGPHGGGKTTLINSLLKKCEYTVENDFDINFLEHFHSISIMDDFERCLLRLYHRMYVANYAQNCLKNCEKNILVSRSVYDSFAYADTYYQLRKISEEKYNIINSIRKSLPNLPKTVILNPDVEIIMERLEKRRMNKERPERDATFRREDQFDFVKMLHANFKKYKNDKNVLYIKNNEQVEIDKVMEWILS